MLLSNLSIRKPVLITMIVMSFAVIGMYSFMRLGIDNWPDVKFPFAVVSVIYPGAGPEEIETQVIKPIEDEVTTVAGIRNITSQCLENRGLVFIEFELGTKIDFAALEVKDKVDAIRPNLPDDLEPPVVLKFDITDQPIMNLALQSKRPPEELYTLADDVVKMQLNRIRGIAQIEIEGGKKREIEVALSKSQMQAHDLTINDVIMGMQMANLNMPGGRIEEGRRDVTIRLEGEFDKPSKMQDMNIVLDGGRTVKLRDIGRVYDGYEDVRKLVRFGGETSVGLSIRKRSDANTVAVADEVKTEIQRVQKLLPPDVKLAIARDNSTFIRSALSDVAGNLIMGILLTAAVLFVFLQSWNGTIIASVAMPLSVIATFLLIDAAGFTINSMTLMGLSISVGILVTNAIVVLDNIWIWEKRGHSKKEAAAKGTSEVALAVAAATLTNIVVFVPIGFMGGIVGQFFREFGLTVAFATVFSLIISFTLTPMMAAHRMGPLIYSLVGAGTFFGVWIILGTWWAVGLAALVAFILWMDRHGHLKRFFNGAENLVNRGIESYSQALNWCLNHHKTLVVSVLAITIGSFMLFPVVGAQFFPQADQGEFYVAVKLPPGTRLDVTDGTIAAIEEQVAKIPEVKTFYSTVGSADVGHGSDDGSQLGGVYVRLVEKNERDRSTNDVTQELRSQLANIPAADIVISQTSEFGGGSEADMQIEVTGDNMTDLLATVDKVQAITASTKGTVDVTNTWITGKPEIKVLPRREELADQGLNTYGIAATLRSLYEGTVATKYRESGKEYDVRVRLDESDRSRLDQVRDLNVKANGNWIPLTAVASITEAGGPTTIYRKNKARLVSVTANLTQGTTGDAQKAIQARIDSLDIPEGITVSFGGEAEFMGREFAYIYRAMLLAIILTYMLMCAMLESYLRPLVILLTLPLGLIGVAIALVLTNTAVSMMVLMGMVMLVGIVVNNAILIIDYAQILRGEGKSLREAVLIAAPGRFRPIIFTNLATILGMLPLAMGVGSGAEWRSPMAIASIGALISSTVLTLFFIPVIYEWVENVHARKAIKHESITG